MSFWDFVPTLISAGTTLWGASQASKTKAQAANQEIQANERSTQQLVDAQNRATDAQLEGIRVATDMQKQQQRAAVPGLIQTQRIIGHGDALTPTQQTAISDARRTTLDALQGGSLRGSARATAATVRDVEGRMTDNFIQSNQNRIDNAASRLTGQYFNAGDNVAELNMSAGDAASKGILGVGQSTANNTATQGQINSINTQNQGFISGSAIGDIGAVIADQIKRSNDEERDSSYSKVRGTA